MKRELKADLKRLEGMSFGRLKHCGPLVERFHALAGRINGDAQAEGIWKVYDWLLAPFALWPLEFEELSADLLKVVESGKLDADFRFFLELMDGPPPAREQRAIAKYEKEVEAGRYDPLLKQGAKFREGERRLREDPDLRVFWERIKKRYEVEKFQNARGVLRRRVTGERNFRAGWKFDWGSERG